MTMHPLPNMPAGYASITTLHETPDADAATAEKMHKGEITTLKWDPEKPDVPPLHIERSTWRNLPFTKAVIAGGRYKPDLLGKQVFYVLVALPPPPPKNKGGRVAKYDWSAARDALVRKIAEEGLPDPELGADGWRCQADVERWVRDVLDHDGKGGPSAGAVREKVGPWLQEAGYRRQ